TTCITAQARFGGSTRVTTRLPKYRRLAGSRALSSPHHRRRGMPAPGGHAIGRPPFPTARRRGRPPTHLVPALPASVRDSILRSRPIISMLERGTIGESRFRTRSAAATTWALTAQGISDARIFVRGRPRGGFSCLMPSPVPTSSTSALIEISFARGFPREFVLADRKHAHRGLWSKCPFQRSWQFGQ